jgi:hypothetical protein
LVKIKLLEYLTKSFCPIIETKYSRAFLENKFFLGYIESGTGFRIVLSLINIDPSEIKKAPQMGCFYVLLKKE